MFAFLENQSHLIKGSFRFWRYGRVVVMLVAFLIAAIPFVHDVGFLQGTLFRIIIGTVLLVHIVVTARTIQLSSQVIGREYQSGIVESLFIAKVNARDIVFGKWWNTVQRVWPSYLFAWMLKVGAAYAFAQYFAETEPTGCAWFRFGFSVCYFGPRSEFTLSMFVAAGGIIFAFGLLEIGLIAAIGVLATLIMRRRIARIVLSLFAKVGLAMLVIISWSQLTQIDIRLSELETQHLGQAVANCNGCYPVIYREQDITFFEWASNWHNIIEATQIGLSPLGDSGVLFSASLMRSLPHLLMVYRVASFALACVLHLFLLWLCLRIAQVLLSSSGPHQY